MVVFFKLTMRTVYSVILWWMLYPTQEVWGSFRSFTENCPSKYNLLTGESGIITVRVKKSPSFCKRQMSRSGPESQTKDLKPYRELTYFKNGEYFFNFTWKVGMNRDKKFPRYALSLQYTITEQNITDQECFVFRLKNRTSVENMGNIRMYFDCIKVQDNIDSGELSLQLWQINCGRSRGKRSSSSCSEITKSRRDHYSLALDDYKHGICSCYYSCGNSKPISNITALYEGRSVVNFKISVANLPSFTKSVTIQVTSSSGKTWEYSTNEEFAVINGSLTFVTNLDTYTVGTIYTITLNYECISGRKGISQLPSKCYPSDKYMLDNRTEITYVDIGHERYHREIQLVLSVTGGTIAFALIVMVVIIFVQRKSKADALHFDSIDTPTEDMTSLIHHDTEIPVLQLHHPYAEPVYREITDTLTDSGILLEDGRDGNWLEFSSNYFTVNLTERVRINITIFVTDGLLELLYGNSESRKKRLVERQYENVPDMIFRGLQALSDIAREKTVLHFVSLNSFKGRQLTQQLLDSGQFQYGQFLLHTYYFQPESLNSEQNQSEVNRLIENICNR